MITASELPAPLLHAFVDALEAWSILEHELFMTWQFLRRSPDLGTAWEDFSRLATNEQRKSTVKLVRDHLSRTQPSAHMAGVFDRLSDLTRTRDRIVHGRWHKVEVREAGRRKRLEYLRLYDARGEPARPRNVEEEQPMLGRSRFYEADLRDTQRHFLEAARDLHWARAEIIGSGSW